MTAEGRNAPGFRVFFFVRATLWFACHGVKTRRVKTRVVCLLARLYKHGRNPPSCDANFEPAARPARGEGGMRMSYPIAYSPRAAAKAFAPPLSERLLRRMIREGVFQTVAIGRRVYLLRSEIEDVLRELGESQS